MTMLDLLKALTPLPKIHYSFGCKDDQLIQSGEFWEVCRICGAVPLSVTNLDTVIAMAAKRAKAANLLLAINYSPWHPSRCPSDVPAAAELAGELVYAANRLAKIRALIGDARVGAVLIDDERFAGVLPDVLLCWRNAIYAICKQAFPGAYVELYGYMAVGPAATDSGWSLPTNWTGLEASDCYGVSLYKPAYHYVQQETYRRTAALNPGKPAKPVTPWLALGAGYESAMDAFHRWNTDWRYPLLEDWSMGAEIHSSWCAGLPARFAPWGRAEHVVFYPSILDARVPTWPNRFVAYVRGAHGITILEGLSVEQ